MQHTIPDYLVFEDDRRAALVLEALEQRFCTSAAFVSGGQEGDRETCRRIGQREVIDFIWKQLHAAKLNPKGENKDD